MCGHGFSVTCPPWNAVGSPPIRAISACAPSWQVVENRNTIYQITPSSRNWGVMPLDRLKCLGPLCKTVAQGPSRLYPPPRTSLLPHYIPRKSPQSPQIFLTVRDARSRLPKQGFRAVVSRGGVRKEGP